MEESIKDQGGTLETAECIKLESEFKPNEPITENAPPIDSELDITSEQFNPLKALYAPEYRVTEKQPKIIYQNMAAFESALKKVGIMGLNSRPQNMQASGSKDKKSLVEEEKQQRRFQDHQMAIKTETKLKSKHHRNIIMQMCQSEGPLKKLEEFVLEDRRVKILIRKEHGIKGYAEGIIKMFDRHWNLLLTDVEECLETRKYKYTDNKLFNHEEPLDCSDILRKLGIKLPVQSAKSIGRKKVQIKRHLPQLMLRGEHVVLISAKKI